MGRPMATNLLEAGHEVVVYNRSDAPVKQLVDRGARAGSGPGDVATQCEIAITCLPGPAEVESVVLGEGGILESAPQGLLFIDMSTVPPATAVAVADAAAERSIQTLDAPVSGGEQGAIDGTLSIMVGGPREAFDRALPVFEVMGRTVAWVGDVGAGQTVKAANQMLVAGTIQLVSEALTLIELSGVDPEPAVQVLAGGLAGNRILDGKAAGMLARQFQPGFRVDLHAKDLGIALGTAAEVGVFAPVTALVAQQMAALQNLGRGSLDHTALMTLVQDLSRQADSGNED